MREGAREDPGKHPEAAHSKTARVGSRAHVTRARLARSDRMLYYLRAGGFSMWIVLAFGIAVLASSFALLRDPDPRRLSTVRAHTWGTAVATLGGVASNVIAVFHYIVRHDDPDALYQGLAEALTPAVLGGMMLSVAWLFVAVAVRRTATRT